MVTSCARAINDFISDKPEKLVEIIELKNHPFFLGTQFHPEFTSRPLKPNPLFLGFVNSTIDYARSHHLIR